MKHQIFAGKMNSLLTDNLLEIVEVFKTNVNDRVMADMLLRQIHTTFSDCEANFDLEDCDRILRVKCSVGFVNTPALINLLLEFGYQAEVLEDEQHPIITSHFQRRAFPMAMNREIR